ncbi:MAG: hypothetical protein DI570_16460 [Phenylobacterium zucineum]|nr:MAG: hypothetical protein DI570_16460 [Phenylobacterium zucineum]
MPIMQTVFVRTTLRAFHTDPTGVEGRHAHTWTVKATFPAEPFVDARHRAKVLEGVIADFQGADLAPENWATEDLAAVILRRMGRACLAVEMDRPDGCGAEARW